MRSTGASTRPERVHLVARAQYKKAIREPSEHLKFHMCEDDVMKWYIILHNFAGDDGEYTGGEYLVRVELPKDFPFNPPSFYFMTPNGLYGLETKVCVSIGEYHKENYRATLGVDGFCKQLVSGLIGWRDLGNGINIKHTSAPAKAQLARESHEYNIANHAAMLMTVNANYAGYSSAWVPVVDASPPVETAPVETAPVETA